MGAASSQAAGRSDPGGRSRHGWRGRDREWSVVAGLLRAAEAGRGGVLLIEGPSGIGKSRLLAEAAEAATARGFMIARGAADELRRLIPLAPLTAAFGESAYSPGAPGAEAGDMRLWLVDQLRTRLEDRVARGAMLVTLDDLQWADPTTLLAVRMLLPDLAAYPLIWMLSRTGQCGDTAVVQLFEALEREGARRLPLAPLDEDAVREIAVDVLGATPDAELLTLAGGAGGNPFLLVELLGGLRDESAIELSDGRTHLVSAELPQRVRATARARLDRLSPQARHLLRVAAVLGRTFSVDDLADMLGEPSGRLLPTLEETSAQQFIAPAGDALAFRHELLWRAVTDGLPAAVRRALHLQAGHILLDRGGSAVPAAAHFLSSAEPGDTRALAGLDRAAREVLPSSPQTAADLAGRALELTDPADPARFDRMVTAAQALTAAGSLTESAELVRTGLGQAPPDHAARLRYELALILLLSGRPEEAVTEVEDVLAQPDIPGELRATAELIWFWGLIAKRDFWRGRHRAEAVVAAREQHGETALVGALMLLLNIAWAEGRVTEGLEHIREAARIASGGSIGAYSTPPRLFLSACLRSTRRLEEADAVLRAVDSDTVQAPGGGTRWRSAGILFERAFLRLVAGRLDDAAAEAEMGLGIMDNIGAHGYASVGCAVLALVALETEDLHAAAKHIEQYHAHAAQGMMLPAGWGDWAVLLVAEAQCGPERAKRMLEADYTEPWRLRWHLATEPNLAAWATRVALASEDRALAGTIADAAGRLADGNPGLPALAAGAAHAHGILHDDAGALTYAAAHLRDPWARASAAEDLGVLLTATDRADAVGSLDQALDGYRRIGAQRDVARVRARLRGLGVRRRHWTAVVRPLSGWDSLTHTERNVAAQVARGLTNRQVADRMFVSPHTVAFHLRNIFRKLDISSRVELARIAGEQQPET